MNIKIADTRTKAGAKTIEAFLIRPAFDAKAEDTAQKVLREIRKKGDVAVRKYAQKFDGSDIRGSLAVSDKEIEKALGSVDKAFLKAVRSVRSRVLKFSRKSLKRDWSMPTGRGGKLGEKFVPFDRIGVYVPGGEAPLASTAMMTIPLAVAAGVKEIVACTPARGGTQVNPYLLAAVREAGATEVYRIGGIQAIGSMAYGTKSIRKVQKIAGPGGTYVTAAKRLVYGDVALDLVAGPSEIAIIADGSIEPELCAADLLSQAEHGTGWEKALLLTTSRRYAEKVAKAVLVQTESLGRSRMIKNVIKRGMLFVVAKSINEATDLSNRFAPEHLELLVKKPADLMKKVTCAGAVFLGRWTPESVGDFAAGPSHVLPTGGAAAMFSGLTSDDFRRRISFMSYSKADLAAALPLVKAFGEVEGLDAHVRSAELRGAK
jgi:histidinol dehydrogenase